MNSSFREKYSKKHHYLPVFYLKQFSGQNDDSLCIYDKVRDDILLNQEPKSKFYSNDLNNYKHNGKVRKSKGRVF